MAVKGVARFYRKKKDHIITTMTEHKCVLDSCRMMEQEGYDVTYLPVQESGLIDLEEFKAAIRPTTALASIMFVNNEIGVVRPRHDCTAANISCSAVSNITTEPQIVRCTTAPAHTHTRTSTTHQPYTGHTPPMPTFVAADLRRLQRLPPLTSPVAYVRRSIRAAPAY